MGTLSFEVLATDPTTGARRGRITTAHGVVQTPAFMPVGTVGSVKGIAPWELRPIGAEILLANAYHLYLRPGVEIVREQGGIARFMGWDGPVLTDSGGYQMFRLADRVKLSEESVEIRSHLDGSKHVLTPESVVAIQEGLGVDVMMPLDDCAPYPAERGRLEEAVRRSDDWLRRSAKAWRRENALFGIVQGGTDAELRRESAERTLASELPGYAVGGLAVGEPTAEFHETAAVTVAFLPKTAPRYLMGTGTPHDLLALIGMGYDLFDCVLPTRNGRNGMLFTSRGKLNIRNAKHARDSGPADPDCDCPVCRHFSRAYLRHLAVAGEMLSGTLNSLHNLAYYLRLLAGARGALERGEFPDYRGRILRGLARGSDDT